MARTFPNFVSKVLETRALLSGASDSETGPSVLEDCFVLCKPLPRFSCSRSVIALPNALAKPVNDPTACDALDHLVQFFRSVILLFPNGSIRCFACFFRREFLVACFAFWIVTYRAGVEEHLKITCSFSDV